MSRPKMFGFNKTYIPNCRADIRQKKLYQRSREYTDKHEIVCQQRRERRMKEVDN